MRAGDLFVGVTEKYARYKNIIQSDRRIYIPLVAFLVVLIALGGYLASREIASRMSVPSVSGANFSLEYRKVPFDVKSLDITFSTDLEETSVTPKSVTLAPFVE